MHILLLHHPHFHLTGESGKDWSPLHLAAWGGKTDILSLLLQYGKGPALDPALPGPGGVTPLHLASKAGHAGSVRALLEDPRCVFVCTCGETGVGQN